MNENVAIYYGSTLEVGKDKEEGENSMNEKTREGRRAREDSIEERIKRTASPAKIGDVCARGY